jgi:uncharacterized protein
LSDPLQNVEEERPEITRAPVTAFVIGLVAGLASALLGIGGGLLMVPAMVFMLRIRQHRAVGTSLAVILPTGMVAAFRYHQEAVARHTPGLEFWVVLYLAIGGVIGAAFGARLASALGAKQLRRMFGIFVAATGMWMIIRAMAHLPQGSPGGMDLGRALEMVGVGVLVGIVSGLLGVGGGLVMVPALALLLAYPQHQAQGTSLAVIIPVSISGALVHMRRGNIIWGLALWLSLGAVTGAWIMAGNVFNIPQEMLRMLFGGFLIAVGVSMVTSRPSRPAGGTKDAGAR